MATHSNLTLQPIGFVESSLTDLAHAPRQSDLGAPEAWLVITPHFADGLAGMTADNDMLLLTWLDQAQRDVLSVRPQGDPESSMTGVFMTRSPHRPSPIGIHRVRIVDIHGNRIHVLNLEALDGTPILDLKSVRGTHG